MLQEICTGASLRHAFANDGHSAIERFPSSIIQSQAQRFMTVYLHFQDNSEPRAGLNFPSQSESKSRRMLLEPSDLWPVVESA